MASSARAGTDAGGRMRRRLRAWMLEGLADMAKQQPGPHAQLPPEHPGRPWWKVMCLTGVDYFSTLGYQPGIAALAAGVLSPIATLVLVLVTVTCALPVYRRVAAESPHGMGSIAMLERLLSFWQGKLFVLALLGFAATDFLITITLSAADATAHLVENPNVDGALRGHEVPVTLVLIALLGAVFLKGFTEAIGLAVALVGVYLTLNLVVVVVALEHVLTHPTVVSDWTRALTAEHGNPLVMIGLALIVFPKLALGLSGFETGVAVMPHIEGDPGDTEERPVGRIRGARKLLTTAALIMCVFLITSSFVTTLLIPHHEFEPGGRASGRALAYLAHEYLGNGFGTVYDISTIVILWFAGASAMAGLLNLMPRYLPRYGMAPHWARAVRPTVLVFTLVAFLVTWIFRANVDAQGGAYATGVLVLISSAAIAVTIAAHKAGQRHWAVAFAVMAAVFVYTTGANVVERPDGVKIGACFIAGIVGLSLMSRAARAFELRVSHVELDPLAERFVRDMAHRTIRFIANEPDNRDLAEYRDKLHQIRADNDLPLEEDLIFVEVTVSDPSEFETELRVCGEVMHGRYRVLTLVSSSVPNALAAMLLHVRDLTGQRPHIYFEWTEGNPIAHFLRFFLFGAGEVAPVTREVLREAEPDRARRPHVHVG
ncbi:amino acid transporter [Streptomyces sparsogenes]|uniref:Amino acid transporter n=1 Tax=Streptomyces sparsogenes DSM 40356 TaxID=1331668 RepID=A0A1R1S8Y6_9ACTN|nr:amino acid transporter [Streptomyces sparsogenes]OMI34775.1 amino acid transporter [Streptomyces sparsogenes DSM 40356]